MRSDLSPPRLLAESPKTSIQPSGLLPEPYGDTPYLELIEDYATQAFAQKNAGAQWIALRDLPGLHEARAAVLGARAAGLPVYVSLRPGSGWDEEQTTELLAALICLQELGVAGFGLDFDAATGGLCECFAALAPYAKTPLTARPAALIPPERLASLLRAGVRVLFHDESNPAQAESAAAAVSNFSPSAGPPRSEDAPLLLCGETEVYYLEEDFTLSAPLECAYDMSAGILALEGEGHDAICFHVETVGDAMNCGRNFHMARQAACILAESSEALEMALIHYSGRALIDARSDVEEARMAELAAMYGAIIR